MLPALFLDRDGVIIENRPAYVRSWSDVHFLPGSIAALAAVRQAPYKIVIVTNQSVVGRGLISLSQAETINQQVRQTIEQAGGRIDGIFTCPHVPADHCTCRKPQPGLLLQAAQALEIDLSRSLLIGDAVSDLQAGLSAGLRRVALVRTGRGATQEALLAHSTFGEQPVYDNLSEALTELVN